MAVLILSGEDFKDTIHYWLQNPKRAPQEFHDLMQEISETVAANLGELVGKAQQSQLPPNRATRRARTKSKG